MNSPQAIEEKNRARRKKIQEEHYSDYLKSLDTMKGKVRLMEGQDMRESIQDKAKFLICFYVGVFCLDQCMVHRESRC